MNALTMLQLIDVSLVAVSLMAFALPSFIFCNYTLLYATQMRLYVVFCYDRDFLKAILETCLRIDGFVLKTQKELPTTVDPEARSSLEAYADLLKAFTIKLKKMIKEATFNSADVANVENEALDMIAPVCKSLISIVIAQLTNKILLTEELSAVEPLTYKEFKALIAGLTQVITTNADGDIDDYIKQNYKSFVQLVKFKTLGIFEK